MRLQEEGDGTQVHCFNVFRVKDSVNLSDSFELPRQTVWGKLFGWGNPESDSSEVESEIEEAELVEFVRNLVESSRVRVEVPKEV